MFVLTCFVESFTFLPFRNRVIELEGSLNEKTLRLRESEKMCEDLKAKLSQSQHHIMEVERRLQTYLDDLTAQKHERENLVSNIEDLKRAIDDGDRDHAKLLEDMISMETANKQLQFDLHVSHF